MFHLIWKYLVSFRSFQTFTYVHCTLHILCYTSKCLIRSLCAIKRFSLYSTVVHSKNGWIKCTICTMHTQSRMCNGTTDCKICSRLLSIVVHVHRLSPIQLSVDLNMDQLSIGFWDCTCTNMPHMHRNHLSFDRIYLKGSSRSTSYSLLIIAHSVFWLFDNKFEQNLWFFIQHPQTEHVLDRSSKCSGVNFRLFFLFICVQYATFVCLCIWC